MTEEEEWLWGWDDTPGIVSIWAEADGRAFVWRRRAGSGALVREVDRFRPWFLLASLDDLRHLGSRLVPEHQVAPSGSVTYQELEGPGALRYLVRADDARALAYAILRGASRRLGRSLGPLRELDKTTILTLAPEEQYLVASGRTYFRGLSVDDLSRAQFDLETTGLDAERDRI
ncbi:MAG: DNA polymerase II, partial [Polyangiaceae bacterium]